MITGRADPACNYGNNQTELLAIRFRYISAWSLQQLSTDVQTYNSMTKLNKIAVRLALNSVYYMIEKRIPNNVTSPNK